MTLEQIIVLALVQGITEFLPISSSGHLILVPVLTGWQDQGLLVDVMAHVGSLAAIIAYFWRDVVSLLGGGLDLVRGRVSAAGRMVLYIAAATVPAVVLGLILKTTGFIDAIRGPHIVAWNAIVFALLMLVADRLGAQRRKTADMTLWSAMAIGAAQALALVPGTSRSGITITAARSLGFTRPEAARFSFLVGMPAIAGAGLLVLGEAVESGELISVDAFVVGGLTFFTSLAAIAFLMAILRRYSLLPFVIYRIVLGIVLLGLIQAGILG
jgi:undecaprenyl-diphosphatase